jgi:hypothetical protein
MVIFEQDIVAMMRLYRVYSREREGGVCGFGWLNYELFF